MAVRAVAVLHIVKAAATLAFHEAQPFVGTTVWWRYTGETSIVQRAGNLLSTPVLVITSYLLVLASLQVLLIRNRLSELWSLTVV